MIKDYNKDQEASNSVHEVSNEYNKIIDALNLIDRQADDGDNGTQDNHARERAYNLVADFIDKHASRVNKKDHICTEFLKVFDGYICLECRLTSK